MLFTAMTTLANKNESGRDSQAGLKALIKIPALKQATYAGPLAVFYIRLLI